MAYEDISDALDDLETAQIRVKLDPNGNEHQISLTVCSDGLSLILSELSDRFNGEALLEICPELKKVDATTLLCSLLSGEEPEDILESLMGSLKVPVQKVASKTSILDNPRVGDVITTSREVVAVEGYYGNKKVLFKDQDGRQESVLASSWKGYGSNRRVSRKS